MRRLVWLFAFIPVILGTLEEYYYPNYVYSHFKVTPSFIVWAYVLFVICFYALEKKFYLKTNRLNWFFTSLIILLVLPGSIFSLSVIIGRTAKVVVYGRDLPQLIQTSQFGEKQRFFNFVKDNTAHDSEIMLPPNRLPWHHTGDTYLMTAFLYPRNAKSFDYYEINNKRALSNWIGKVSAILISSEEDGAPMHVWPDFPVPAEKIVIFDWDTNSAKVYEGRDYVPGDWIDSKPWGLIFPKKI